MSLRGTARASTKHASLLTQMVEALRHDDVNDMLDALSCFFANIPANITVKREKYYQPTTSRLHGSNDNTVLLWWNTRRRAS